MVTRNGPDIKNETRPRIASLKTKDPSLAEVVERGSASRDPLLVRTEKEDQGDDG
jgi:hypothetical protein